MEPKIFQSIDNNLRNLAIRDGKNYAGIRTDFESVGMDIFQALNEVSYEMGGVEFAEVITEAAFEGYDVLPDFKAFQLPVRHNPNAVKEVLDCSSEIQKQRHQEEIDVRFPVQSRLRKIGRGIMDANTLIWTGQRPK